MVRYEIRMTVNPEVLLEFLAWLRDEHIPVVLERGDFMNARLFFKNQGDPLREKCSATVLYMIENEEKLNKYFTEWAPELRAQMALRWSDDALFHREVWLETETFQNDKNAFNLAQNQVIRGTVNSKKQEDSMPYTFDAKKLITDLRGPKGVAALSEELGKVSHEINKLSKSIKPQAEAKLHEARAKFDEIEKALKTAQGDLDKEVNKTITLLKKIGGEAETKIRTALAKRGVKTSSKKAAAPKKAKTSKKAAKATSKKKTTSKKA